MSTARSRNRPPVLPRVVSTLLLCAVLTLLVAITYVGLEHVSGPIRSGVVENIAANLITASIFTVLGASAFVWLSVTQRRRLFRFFGVGRGTLDVRMYLSRLQIQPGGASGTEPITNGYVGPAIVKMDYDAGLLLVELFQPRALALIPDVLRDLLSTLFISLAEVDAHIEVAPTPEDFAEDRHLTQPLVACGGAIYNVISSHYLNQERSFYYFAKNAAGHRVMRARDPQAPDLEALGRSRGHELACIQRLREPTSDSIVFVCAGLGSGATYGSVEYLVRNWRRLWHRYGDAEFGICLSFATAEYDEMPDVTPKVVHQIGRPRGRAR
ncbi:MAG TPA: hypothetical protein VIC85_16715 [Ktedonobacterales bacterium]